MMHFWNQDNFKGFKEIGVVYQNKKDFEGFSQYCQYREKGLKKPAFKALNEFIFEAKQKPFDQQKEIAVELTELKIRNRKVHQLVAQPLRVYLIDIFKKWADKDNNCSIPCRWIGYLSSDITYLEKALKIDPSDQIVLVLIIKRNLDALDYHTHHLSESSFVGDLSEAKDLLNYTKELIDRIESEEQKKELQAYFDNYDELIHSWEIYQTSNIDQSFPEWYRAQGKELASRVIVYYPSTFE